jgi:hypothetical protein
MTPGTLTVWFNLDLNSSLEVLRRSTEGAIAAQAVAQRLGYDFVEGDREVDEVKDLGLTAPFSDAGQVFAALAQAGAIDGQVVDLEAENGDPAGEAVAELTDPFGLIAVFVG